MELIGDPDIEKQPFVPLRLNGVNVLFLLKAVTDNLN